MSEKDEASRPGSASGDLPPEHLVDALHVEIGQLRLALQGRDVLGQAKGIIRLLTHCDADTAFDLLAKISQHTNRKVGDVAFTISECAASQAPLPPDISTAWNKHVIPRSATTSGLDIE